MSFYRKIKHIKYVLNNYGHCLSAKQATVWMRLQIAVFSQYLYF